jgi:IS5 family transposase
MRGQEDPQTSMFSYISLEERVPQTHPLRRLRELLNSKKRSNKTHQSTTDPEARLFKKGRFTEAKLRYMTHALSENRNGLIVDVETTEANGRAEWEAAQRMLERSVKKRGATVGADKGYDTEAFVGSLERLGLRAHVAHKSRHKGLAKLSGQAVFTFAAYNLRRLLNLMGPSPHRDKPACRGAPRQENGARTLGGTGNGALPALEKTNGRVNSERNYEFLTSLLAESSWSGQGGPAVGHAGQDTVPLAEGRARQSAADFSRSQASQ